MFVEHLYPLLVAWKSWPMAIDKQLHQFILMGDILASTMQCPEMILISQQPSALYITCQHVSFHCIWHLSSAWLCVT